MIDVLPTVLTVLALAGAVWSVVLIVLNQPLLPFTTAKRGLLALLAALETGLFVQAVVGLGQITSREIDRLSFAGYLIGAVVIIPVAVVWAAGERSRWSGGVLAVGCLSIPVMVLRLGQIWAAHA
jgi:nucleoside recognition membrane protein YjiH